MAIDARINIDLDRSIGKRDRLIFGQFIEHFHRQIYGGLLDPGSPFADKRGFRMDVIDAIKHLKPSVMRWPGGCFASAYHWKDGIEPYRQATWDKAWRVEDPNTFGTDEFIAWCREIDTEPYICVNAGSGTWEEMSDWVEYCNLKNEGKWSKLRIANGHPEPYGVKYWSVGNENYIEYTEIGARKPQDWAEFAAEGAKMMKRVDLGIKIIVPSWYYSSWAEPMLKRMAYLMNFIAIHGYGAHQESPYMEVVAGGKYTEKQISKMENILGSFDYLGKIDIAIDEWNPHGWNISFDTPLEVDYMEKEKNEINSIYTMGDAISQSCFFNNCFRHCRTVKMANFSSVVNTRGVIYTHSEGIVLRSTYHVFDLYVNHTYEEVLDAYCASPKITYNYNGNDEEIAYVDASVTIDRDAKKIAIAVSNAHPEEAATFKCWIPGVTLVEKGIMQTVNGDSISSYNDIDHPDDIKITRSEVNTSGDRCEMTLQPHSVNVITLPYVR